MGHSLRDLVLTTTYRRKRVYIASSTSFWDRRAWFSTIYPWGWRPEIVCFGCSCSSTAISALADQSILMMNGIDLAARRFGHNKFAVQVT